MAKHLITFEVDDNQLFDTLHKMAGDTSALGSRVVSALLAPNDVSMLESIGMGWYGIYVVKVEKADTPSPTSGQERET